MLWRVVEKRHTCSFLLFTFDCRFFIHIKPCHIIIIEDTFLCVVVHCTHHKAYINAGNYIYFVTQNWMLSFSFLLTIVQYVAHVISFLYVLYISWLISRSLVVTVQPNECCQTENVLVYVTLVCSFYRQMKHYKTLILCPGCKYRTVSNMATRLCKMKCTHSNLSTP